MTQILIAISTALHAIATVIFIGHHFLLSVLYLPILSKNGNGAALSEISKKSRPWLYASLLVFIITGTHLMLVDSGYLGFMNFGNLWGIAMLVKHILILGMIGLGFWFNGILRVGPLMSSSQGAEQTIARFRWYCNAMSIVSLLVLLLTAVAQVQ